MGTFLHPAVKHSEAISGPRPRWLSQRRQLCWQPPCGKIVRSLTKRFPRRLDFASNFADLARLREPETGTDMRG